MIVVVDYGAGNIHSVRKALENVGARVVVSDSFRDIERCRKIVLPGVGAFGNAMEALNSKHLVGPLVEAMSLRKPFLGICLGFQMLFSASDENPDVEGMAVFVGRVKRFSNTLKVPHLGWNGVEQITSSPLWQGIPDRTYFYFAHSYFVEPQEPSIVSGKTEYGEDFASAVSKDNRFGVQFHPEKSQKWGLQLLKNFVRL